MTKSAGVEYAPRGIRINAICPGTIDTPMVADMLEGQTDAMAEIMKEQVIGRLGRAEEVAAAVLWLCSPGARRSEEHPSELQSLMRLSYAVFCLNKKTTSKTESLQH